jgi:predicted dehydrogenase
MSSRIRVGILGCASIAKRSLAPAFASHANFDLVAVASRTPDKAAELAGRHGAIPCSYEELLARDDVDLVYCPLPTGLHHEWVRKCLLGKKHVLCEKSLACNFDEVADLVEIARGNRLFLMESFQFRFHPQNLYVKRLLQEGAIGEIRGLDVKFGFPPFPDGARNIRYSKALGGGALLDSGAYTIKATTYLLGDDFQVKAAACGKHPAGEVDLDGHLWLQSQGGLVAKTAYGFHNFYQCGYEIWGEKGKISTSRAFTARPDFEAEVKVETNAGTKVEKFQADHFALMLDHVSRQIEEGGHEEEYNQCLVQSRILTQAQHALGLV